MHCAANIRNFSQKFAAHCKFLPFLGIFCSALHFSRFFTKNFVTKYFVYNWIRTSAPAYVEQSFQPIYHPSRFIVEIHINLLIYRYFNGVTDTPENGNIHHAITHDLAPSLTIFAPPGIACRH